MKRTHLPLWLQAAVALSVIGGFGYTLGTGALADLLDGPDTARLRLGEVVVVNGKSTFRSVDSSYEQSRDTAPQVDVTVRNTGSSTAWIRKARITVLDSARIPDCVYAGGAGGQIPQSVPYRITLPELPLPSERVIRRSLHEEVGPGDAHRVLLIFQPKSWVSPNQLFAIQIQLIAEPPRQVFDVGRFVLSVPDPISRAGYVLPEDPEVLGSGNLGDERLASTWCLRRNLDSVRRITALPGKRSPQTAALEHVRPAGNWRRYANDRPPADAVEPLFNADEDLVPEAPALAAFAAAASGNQALADATRARAADRLLATAREELRGPSRHPEGAIRAIRQALALVPSAEAKSLLWRAEAAQQAVEEELAEKSS